jgi:DedD protein
MGLFSFGNKDASSTSGRANSASGAASRRAGRSGERAERMEAAEGLRRRRRGEPADANMLDPTLPEKQRARRRLIGAIALVLAAVVILPMVLDSHPKPATDGIAIEIPAHDDSPAPAAPAQSSTTAYEAAAGDRDDNGGDGSSAATDAATRNGTDSAAPDSNKSAAANSATANGTKSSGTKSAASAKSSSPGNSPSSGNSTAAANANAPAATGGATDKTGNTSNAETAASRKTTAAKAPTANDAPPAGSHFVVQIGSFAADAPAQAWVTRLKAAGVPAYVQHSRQDDGSDRVLVRAGPFTDRAAAEAAVRKVRSVDAPEDPSASAAGQ